MIVIIWRIVSQSCFLHTSCHFIFCNGHIHFQKGRFLRDRPTNMVTTKRNTHSTQMQTLLQTACNVTDSVLLTCQQVGWFIDRRGKPVGGLRWRRRVPPLLPAGRLSADYCYPTATHPAPTLLLLRSRDGHAVNTLATAIFFLPTTPTLSSLFAGVGLVMLSISRPQLLSSIHPISSSWAWAFDKSLWNSYRSYPYMFSLHSYLCLF